jgi:intracellular septation protein A
MSNVRPLNPTRISMKLLLSMYWRALVVQVVLAAVFLSLLSATELMSSDAFIKLKPTAMFAAMAATFLVSLASINNGLLHLAWGSRLNQSPKFWRRFTIALAALLLVLAIANLVAVYWLSTENWIQYKTFVPAAALLAFSFCASTLFAHEKNVAPPLVRQPEA